MRRFRFIDLAVVGVLAGAGVTTVDLVQAVRAESSVASALVPIVPCRLADTRPVPNQVGGRGAPLAAGETATFAVWGTNGNCTIPNTATGLATNITAVNPTANGFLTVFPADAASVPLSANLNWTPTSPPTPNQVTVGLSAAGAIKLFNSAGSIDVVIDVVGYYVPSSSGTAGAAGPPGPPGPQGSPGPTGPAGPKGSNAGRSISLLVAGNNYVFPLVAFIATTDLTCFVVSTVQADLSGVPAGDSDIYVRNAIKRNGVAESETVYGFWLITDGIDGYDPALTRTSLLSVDAGDTVQFGAFLGNVTGGAVGDAALVHTTYECS